jgi:hypothetical protein
MVSLMPRQSLEEAQAYPNLRPSKCREKARRRTKEFLRRAMNDAADAWPQLTIESATRKSLKFQGKLANKIEC